MAVSRSKRIVLTGVSRGLGLAMAEGFINEGHTVVVCARDEKVLAVLRKRWPQNHRFEKVDVALNPGIIDTEMLHSCFGESAGSYPDAEDWGRRAVPFILKIGAKDNGVPLTVPAR